ncbi:MAG: DUF5011 domain-containing protein [Coriobacteriia bacterium]|nr:DUF5011 domain-containing protein [Coriobacteriia bacterium]
MTAKRSAGNHARAVGQPAKRSGSAGPLKKALAILLALNMAIMLMIPAGAIADQVVAPPSDDLVAATDGTQEEQSTEGTDGGEEEATYDDVEYADEADEVDDVIEPEDTFEAVDEPEADDPDEAIAPLTVTPLGPGQVSVDNWVDLCAAMADTSVNYIEFTQNIQRTAGQTAQATDLPAIARSLTINGKGFTLDFNAGGATTAINRRGIGLQAATNATLTIKDLSVIKTNVGSTAANQNTGHFIASVAANGNGYNAPASAGWTIVFENLEGAKGNVLCGLVFANQSIIRVTNAKLDWYSGGANAMIMNTMQQYYSGAETEVNIVGHENISTTTNFIEQNISNGLNVFDVRGGAKVLLDSGNTGNTNTINMQVNENAQTRTEFYVDGEGTELIVEGVGRGTDQDGGTVCLVAGRDNAIFQVTGGAHCSIYSRTPNNNGQCALVTQCNGTKFLADGEGTELEFHSWGQSNNLGATLRFRLTANQTFKATNKADITVFRHENNGSYRAAAIRFYGTDNSFIAETGATIHIINEGSAAVATSATGDNNNSGIEYRGARWSFDITGYQTAVEIHSLRGPAIGAGSAANGSVNMGKDTVFIAEGNSNANDVAAVDTSTNFEFTSNQPLFYDFVNINPSLTQRVRAFNVNAGSTFTQTNSDIAVWGNGRSRMTDAAGTPANSSNNPIDGNPYMTWTMVSDLSLSGNNFIGNFASGDQPYITNTVENFGNQGTWPYRRVSGNNAAPRIGDFVDPITNADKYARAFATVPEGLNFSGRHVWDDEAYTRWTIQRDGNTINTGSGETDSLRYDDYYEVETDVGTYEGVVRYFEPNDGYLHSGDVLTIVDAWRGQDDDPNSKRIHRSDPSEINSGSATVIDILPPAIAVITDPTPDAGKNGRIWAGITDQIKGTWLDEAAQKAAEPHNPEPAVVGYAILVSGTTQTELGEINLNTDGTWDYTIPEDKLSTLKEGDKIYIVLEDENENRNPLEDTPCHDIMVEAAPYMTVSLPDILLDHTDAYIGTIQAAEIADLGQDSPAQWEELLKVLDAKGTKRNASVTMDPAIKVLSVEPMWDVAEYYNLPEFKALNPKGKVYAVTYGVVADPSINRIGYITVIPFEKGTPFIGANDFTITVNNATEVMSLPIADRDAKLIELAGAEGRYNVNDDFDAANVKVVSVAIPNPAKVGEYDVTFGLKEPNKLPAGTPIGQDQVTITATVIDGNMPIIELKNPIEIWIGDDPNDPKRMKTDSFLPGEFTAMYGVTAWSELAGADITDKVTYTGTWDETKVDIYPVTYSVTNDDGNSVSAVRSVIVNDGSFQIDDFGAIKATGFVKKQGESDPNTILTDAKAEAWIWDESAPDGKVKGTPEVVQSSIGSYAMNCPVGDYPLQIQIKEDTRPANERLISDIVATVITKDVIETGTDPDTNKRYSVGANHVNLLVSEAAAYANSGSPANSSDAVKLMLINKSEAEAWYLTDVANKLNTAPFDLTSLDQAGVVVLENNIPANPTNGSTYTVTFGVKESPGITATVNYLVSGTPPMIVFEEAPLIIDFVPGSTQNLTAAEIKDKLMVVDAQDDSATLWDKVTFTVDGSATKTISKGVVGVYSVTYNVTNSIGLAAEPATRAIIINDGRYVVDDDPENGLIIGAKNFIIQKSEVNGSEAQVATYSRAYAYNVDGTPIQAPLVLTCSPLPAAYKAGCDEGDYPFTWRVDGSMSNLTKPITGTVVDADHIFPGGDNDQYAMTANDFWVNVEYAQAMIAAGLNPSLIKETEVKVYPLVTGVPAAEPYVINNGGFKAEEAAYPLSFGAQLVSDKTPITTSPATVVNPTGTVSNGKPPVLTASTPIEIWIGDGSSSNPNAITPAQWTGANNLYQVTATDEEDDAAGIPLVINTTFLNPASGVDVATPGIYTLKYDVTDSDKNYVEKFRTVVVNDGSYVVSPNDGGRILYARSFVIKLSDVAASAGLDDQVLSMGRVELYNGTTGAKVDNAGNVIVQRGTYGPTKGEHAIKINANDTPTGQISKDIIGEVVDADVIGPDNPDPFGPVTYVYGNNITQTVDEAVSTATPASGAEAKILAALEASATKMMPNGSSSKPGVKIVEDMDNYVTKFSGTIPADPTSLFGYYHFKVSDMAGETTIELTIRVGDDNWPEISVTPKPLNIMMPVASGDQSGGNLTAAKIKEGLVASDPLISDAKGNVTDKATYAIKDVTDGAPGKDVTNIPTDKPGVYQVVYSYTNANYLTVTDSRAIIINDGRYVVDDKNILEALSFVIRASDVDTANATTQILEKSEARAWTVEGETAGVTVSATGSYGTLAMDYKITIQVQGGTLSKNIVGKVVFDGDTNNPPLGNYNGENGVTYSVIGHNFRVNETVANQMKAEATSTLYPKLLELGGVEIRDRTSDSFGQAPSMTKELVSDGGFKAAPGTLKEGDSFTLTVRCAEDTKATTTIVMYVNNGGLPEITAPEVRFVWGGDPAKMPSDPRWISKADWIAQNGMQGVTANDPEDHDITSLIKVGTLTGTTFTEVKPINTSSPVNLEKKNVYQDISYQVTDSDFNTVTKTVKVYVGTGTFIGDYFVTGYDFVETVDNVMANGTSDSVVIGLAAAHAWRYVSNDPTEELPVASDHVLTVDKDGYKAEVGDYPIKFGVNPEPGYVGGPETHDVVGKVVDKDVLGDKIFDEDDIRYIVGAKHAEFTLTEAPSFTGLSTTAQALVIERAFAEAWKSVGGEGISDVRPVVKENTIPANPVPGTAYPVTFMPEGQPDVTATVNFTLASNDPIITFQEAPLVFEKTADSKILTAADIKAKMTVTDVEDDFLGIDLWAKTTYTIAGGLTQLDQANVGVWNVVYSITDTDGNTTTAERAVVVDDGRYVIDKNDDVIIGARDYVVKSKGDGSVDGTEGQARSLSWAEAYDIDGKALVVNWTAAPMGYVQNADPGDYPITWKAADRNTTKSIVAHVVDADYVNQGDKSASYAIYASDFRVNLTQAAAILAGAPQTYINAANAGYVKLVPNPKPPQTSILLGTNGGFRAELGTYTPITFRLEGVTPTQDVSVTGVVSQGEVPVLNVSTPLEIWVGDPNYAGRSGILPSEYTGDMHEVSATDFEDDRDGKPLNITATPDGPVVNATKDGVGLYKINYSVTDSDDNTVTAERIVVVNDGTYKVGDGRILQAKSFIALLKDVKAPYSTDILGRSEAALFNGTNGQALGAGDVSVWRDGGYGAAVGKYPITIRGVDVPTGFIDKDIIGEVVDAEEIFTDGEYTIFGSNLQLRIGEAQTILDSGNVQAALVEALKAGSRWVHPTGEVDTLETIILEPNFGGFKAETGTYNVTVSDAGKNISLPLTIQVGEGNFPTIQATPMPLNIPWVEGSTAMVSREQIMTGVTANDIEDGVLTDKVVINPDSANKEVLPQIPLNTASVTQITYWVMDSDLNTAQVTRALIVNDGSISFDENWILQARSFVIESKDVDNNNIPGIILENSEAKAWRSNGSDATAMVRDTASMNDMAGTYRPILAIQEAPNFTRTITARVLDSRPPFPEVGGNGDAYSIKARSFRINLADAAKLQSTNGSAYDNEFLTRALVESYVRADTNLSQGGTPKLVDDGGFRTATFTPDPHPGTDPNYPTVIPVKFWVDEDHEAFVWVDVIVSNGEYPWINVPALKSVALNANFTDADFMRDVTYGDAEDDPKDLKVVYAPTSIDTSKEGIYEVTYTVTDTENNSTSAIGYVMVGWEVDGDYAVNAGDFITTVNDINSATNPNDLILQLSHAQAKHVVRDADGNVTGLEDWPAAVKNNGGFRAAVGTYSNIEIGVAEEDKPVKKISAQVINKDVISNTPDEDGNVNDTNTNDPNDTNRYIVGANNVMLRVSEAAALAGKTDAASVAKLVALAEAQGFKIAATGGSQPHNVTVSANNIEGKVGSYTVTFIPEGVGGVEATVTFTVGTGNLPVLTPERPVVVPVAPNNGSNLTNDQKRGKSTAYDVEDGDLTSQIKVDGNVPANKPGIYQVTMTVTDSDGNTSSVKAAVVVDDGNIVFDATHILYAKNFTIAHSAVNMNNRAAQILQQSAAQATRIDGTPVSVRVSALGGYTNAGGTYKPVIAVVDAGTSSLGTLAVDVDTADATIDTLAATLTKTITATVTQPLPRYKVTFNANGGRLTGPSALYVQRPATTIAYLPSDPVRKGYSFNGWYTKKSGGSAFTASTTVNANRTVYAHWTKDAAPPQPRIVVNPPATYVNVAAPPAVTVPGETRIIEVDKTPATPPVVVDPPEEKFWSLFNLLVVILSALLALGFLIKFFFDRRKEDEDRDRPAKQKSMYVNAPVLLIAVIAFIEGLVVLLVTQDFTAKMGIIDQYSLPLSLIVFVQLLVPMVAALLKKNRDDREPYAPQPQVVVQAPVPQTVQRTYIG